MCSSNIVYSSESARGVRVVKCGEVTQDRCVETVDVNYVCDCDMPASEDARQIYVEKIKVGESKAGNRRSSDVGSSVRSCDTTRGTGGLTGENSIAEPKKRGEADGGGLTMNFYDEFVDHARKLSSTSLSEIISQVREHKRDYDNDKSEYMEYKAILTNSCLLKRH